MCLTFLDMSIPKDGSVSISFSNEESASPTCRGEIGRVCISALIIGAGQGGLLDLPGDGGLDGQVRVDTLDLIISIDQSEEKGRTRWKPFKFL